MRTMMCGRWEIIIACLLSRLSGRRWVTGNKALSPVAGRKGSVVGLPFGRSTGMAGRRVRSVVSHDVNGTDDKFVLPKRESKISIRNW